MASIGFNKIFQKIDLSLGFSIENLGSILKNYTNCWKKNKILIRILQVSYRNLKLIVKIYTKNVNP